MFNSSSRSIHFAAMCVMALAGACAESSNPARLSSLSGTGMVHDGDPSTNDVPTSWFGHQEPPSNRIVGPTPQLFGQRFDGPMEGHIPDGSMPWHWDLHAWIWQANPDGIFAPFNPTVRCR